MLFGAAGSGKSIKLQQEFIKHIKNWKIGDLIPIYINLAITSDLEVACNNILNSIKIDPN